MEPLKLEEYLSKKVMEFSYFPFCEKKQGALPELFTLRLVLAEQ
jgi:hypothetical protein